VSARVRVAVVVLLAAWVAACAAGPVWLLLVAVVLAVQGGRMVRVDLVEHGTGRGPRGRVGGVR
jgi:predicted anti-sigma-YlaC factor YlaD